MRILNFQPGDPVQITRSGGLQGKVYQVGGKTAKIEVDRQILIFPLTRLRHTGYPLTRRVLKMVEVVKQKLQSL